MAVHAMGSPYVTQIVTVRALGSSELEATSASAVLHH